MKKLNRIIGIILSLTLLLSCFSGTAFAATQDQAAVGDGENGDYAFSSLYVIGSSANGAFEWLNGAGNYTLSESNLMTDYGNGYYKIDFFDVPYGSDYEFKIAAPTGGGVFEFGWNDTAYDPGISYGNETNYAMELYGDSIYFDLEAKANVSVTVDATNYDPCNGTGLTASVYIEYTEQRYALECCQELYWQYGFSSPDQPCINMLRNGDRYEYTFYDIPQTSQMLWCYVMPLDNSGTYPYYPDSNLSVFFKADPSYFGPEGTYATIYYYPDTQTVGIDGFGIVTPNCCGFYSLSLETSKQSWCVNNNYETSFEMQTFGSDYNNSLQYVLNLYDLEPLPKASPDYPDEEYFEFYFKTDADFNNLLACGQNSDNEFISNGLDDYFGEASLVSSYDLYDSGIKLPRFKLTTKSDVRITVTVCEDSTQPENSISMEIEITPKAPVSFICGTENLAGESQSLTPNEQNLLYYSDSQSKHLGTYLENVGDFYEFYVVQRYGEEITLRGYNNVSYTSNINKYDYDYETGCYDLPDDAFGLYPYRFVLTEPCYVDIYFDESTGIVSIYGEGIRTLAPYEFTSLSVAAGRIIDEYGSQLEGLYPNTGFELYTMYYNENGYGVKFKNLPAGENYFFSVIADPAINYDPFYEYSGAFPSQFALGAEQWDYYPTGSSETVYSAEPGQRLTKFNLDINADVDIFFDDAYYDIYSGTGGSIILRITPIRGDVNGDAEVDITDATDIQYALAQLEEFTPAQERNADVDGDGQMSIKDVTRIQKYLAGMIESL